MSEETKLETKPQWARTPLGVPLLVIAGFIVGGFIGFAGLNMVTMQSVAGNTLAEAYYQASGYACLGLALFCACVLWALAALVGRR
jgi:hypothetical protein